MTRRASRHTYDRRAAAIGLAAVCAAVAACTGDAPRTTDGGPAASAPAGTAFTATVTCPIPGKAPETVAFAVARRVGPPPPAPCVGEACRELMLTEVHCTWSGMAIAGQPLTGSVWHGQGYMQGAAGNATGYDWGTLANGDSYLSRWTETVSAAGISGTWTVALGTGGLEGLSGNATFTCVPPRPEDTAEVCTFTGTYQLSPK